MLVFVLLLFVIVCMEITCHYKNRIFSKFLFTIHIFGSASYVHPNPGYHGILECISIDCENDFIYSS